jgi:hypothetical protein
MLDGSLGLTFGAITAESQTELLIDGLGGL